MTTHDRIADAQRGATSILVRPVVDQDVPTLQALIPVAARELKQSWHSDCLIGSSIHPDVGVYSELIADGTFLVAIADGQIIGCGGWRKRTSLCEGDHAKAEVNELLDAHRDAARICFLFVPPDWTRQGIERKIIERCELAARAKGFTSMELDTTLPGELLYAAMGYNVTERFVITLSDGVSVSCTHMIKALI